APGRTRDRPAPLRAGVWLRGDRSDHPGAGRDGQVPALGSARPPPARVGGWGSRLSERAVGPDAAVGMAAPRSGVCLADTPDMGRRWVLGVGCWDRRPNLQRPTPNAQGPE